MGGRKYFQKAQLAAGYSLSRIKVKHEVGQALFEVAKARERSTEHIAATILEGWYETVYLPHVNKKAP